MIAASPTPIAVPDPGTEHGRRLLQTLGVTIIPPDELKATIRTRELVIPPDAVPAAFRDLVAGELGEARNRALQVMPLGRRCKACGIGVDHRTVGCRTCSIRHGWRAWDARRKAAALTAGMGRRYAPPA